jgi:hypothetical protein
MSAPKIFISYSHDDTDWVRAFADALRHERIEVWLDQWEVKLGDSVTKGSPEETARQVASAVRESVQSE